MTNRQGKHSRRWIAGWIVGSMVAITGAAVAATITIFLTSQLGSGVSNVATSCDSSITFEFGTPAYDQAVGDYAFTSVNYGGLDVVSCDNQTMRVSVISVTNTVLATGTLLIDDSVTLTSGPITLSQPVAVSQTDRVAAAITTD
jgi:hypothetical protein